MSDAGAAFDPFAKAALDAIRRWGRPVRFEMDGATVDVVAMFGHARRHTTELNTYGAYDQDETIVLCRGADLPRPPDKHDRIVVDGRAFAIRHVWPVGTAAQRGYRIMVLG